MLIIAIILFGFIVGGLAQWILGTTRGGPGGTMEKMKSQVNWPLALGAGVLGSFLGGLIGSLVAGEGFALRSSGIIGSVIGAIILTAIWQWWQSRKTAGTSH